MSFILSDFDYQPRSRLVFGVGAVDRLGELARDLAARRVLVVTDRGLVAAGHVERASRALKEAGLEVSVFDRVRENPTTRDVEKCLEVARASGIDTFIGLGGGSSIDTAKGCNFLLTNGGKMEDYRGIGKAVKPMLPLIAVPTTAGTGSECQSFALIAEEETHQKMACGDPKAMPCIALLDPSLTLTMPRHVTACAGIDSIAHAVESAVSRKRNALSMLYSREASRLTVSCFPRVLSDPEDLEARAGMLLGAAYAGIAIENSMLGAAHSAANPLTAHFGVIHGQAVGIMLPHVMRFNALETPACETYRNLSREAGLVERNTPPKEAAGMLAKHLEHLIEKAGWPSSLASFGVEEADIPLLAAEANAQWTARFNPREITVSDFQALYHVALMRD